MKFIALSFTIALLFTMPVRAQTQNHVEIEHIKFKAAEAFLDDDFAKLERQAEDFRRTRARLRDGRWKLAVFYSGIYEAMDAQIRTERRLTKIEEKVKRWANAYPNSPSPPIVLSNALRNHGWYYRGGAYVNEVSTASLTLFNHYLDLATQTLVDTRSFASTDPQWYVEMLRNARDRGWGRQQFYKVFNESTSRYPLYFSIYYAAADYFAPKWGDSVEEIEAVANRATELTRTSERQALYADIYWYVSEKDFKNIFTETRVQWPKMRAGFDDILALHSDPFALNAFAQFACQAHDEEKTRQLLRIIGSKPLMDVWSPNSFYTECQAWAANPMASAATFPQKR